MDKHNIKSKTNYRQALDDDDDDDDDGILRKQLLLRTTTNKYTVDRMWR
jgi:hypothetical protein